MPNTETLIAHCGACAGRMVLITDDPAGPTGMSARSAAKPPIPAPPPPKRMMMWSGHRSNKRGDRII